MDTSVNSQQQPSWSNPHQSPSRQQQQPQPLSGSMNETGIAGGVGGGDDDFLTQPFSTLDEPVMETIMRDVRSVGTKLKVVLLPLDTKMNPLGYDVVSTDEEIEQSENQKEVIKTLRDWDLWGPLVVCLSLSILLSIRAPSKQASPVFAAVFCSMWIGSAIVTINAQLLGGTISFFQSVCVLGYCVFPFVLSATLIVLLNHTWFGMLPINLLLVLIAFLWASRASTVFIGQYIKRERRFLAVFPVLLFYTLLGWFVLLF